MAKGQRKLSAPRSRSAPKGKATEAEPCRRVLEPAPHIEAAELPDGVMLWDQKGHLRHCNSAMTALFGEAPPWRIGETFAQVSKSFACQLLLEGPEAGKKVLDSWRKQRRYRRGHLLLNLNDGRSLLLRERALVDGGSMTLFCDVSALRGEDRALRQRQVVLERTISELEMAQYKLEEQSASVVGLAEELSLAKREVERANEGKTNFLRIVSHELRTPLNSIIGFAELLKQESLGPIGNRLYAEYAGDILSSGQHLLNLVNHLLDLSRIEAGRYEIHLEQAAIADIIGDSLRLVRKQAVDADITIDRDLPEGLPELWVDEQAIRQIAVNLLSNAIKYTPAGGHVQVRVQADDQGLAVSVKDDGVGIPAHIVPRLMRPFERGDNNLGRRTEGIGLGLAISRALAELHGGSLSIESVNGQGTTATLSLPLERPAISSQTSERRQVTL